MADSSDAADELLTRLADEFAARHRAGEHPGVEEYCTRHPDLADDVRALFPALVELERAKADAGAGHAAEVGDDPPLTQLGDFRLLREVGRGGMGVVFEAEQVSLGRRVAIKLLPAGVFRDAGKRRRFEREAKAAARLHHTNIVPVHGYGEHAGTPYYVMQFIPGLGLDAVLDELASLTGSGRSRPGSPASAALARSLAGDDATPPERGPAGVPPSSGVSLPGQSAAGGAGGRKATYWQSVARIGAQVAGALAYAHKQGVLHRDIKPGNLLLDLNGTVWVTDFGLAKADDSDDLTNTGDQLGTLRYMPPEAFEGKADARGDVYALGLTLYELVALHPAFDERDRNKLLKQVTTGDPPPLRRLRPDAPRDLVTIVEKASAREAGRRYPTAGALADDLQRFLDGRPIAARRATEVEKLWMWARRRPATAGLVAALAVCLVAGIVVSTLFARAALERENDATVARDDAKRVRDAAARQAAGLLFDRAAEDATAGEPARALHLFVRALQTLVADDPEAAPLARVIRVNLAAWAETVPALEHVWDDRTGAEGKPGSLPRMVASPDGERIAFAVGPDAAQGFRTDTGHPVGPPVPLPGLVGALAFAADGATLWAEVTSGEDRCAVHRLDPATGRQHQPPIAATGPVYKLLPTPDGRHLVAALSGVHPDDAGTTRRPRWVVMSVVVWDAASGRVVRSVAVPGRQDHVHLGIGPDGRTVAVYPAALAPLDGVAFELTGDAAPTRLPAPGAGATFRTDMQSGLVVADGQVHRWTAAGALGPGVAAPFSGLKWCIGPDGRTVIDAQTGQVFDVGVWPPRPSGVRFAHPGWLREESRLAEFTADGRFLATWIHGVRPSELSVCDRRLWRLPRPHSRPPLPAHVRAKAPGRPVVYGRAAFDAGATRAVLTHASYWGRPVPADGSVRVVDAVTGAARPPAVRHAARVRHAAFSPDGRYFATGSNDNTARVWDAATGAPAGPVLRHGSWVACVAFSPDGTALAAGDYGPAGLVRFWDWRTGAEVRAPLRHDDIVLHVEFSPDGRYVAVVKAPEASKQGELLVWEVASGAAVVRVPHVHGNYLVGMEARFRPDGRAAAARDRNGVLRLWEVPSGRLLCERPLDGEGVHRFSADGRMLAAAVRAGVRLLDPYTLAPLPGGFLPVPDPIKEFAIGADGALLLTAHNNGSAQLWDVATRKPLGPPVALLGWAFGAALTPDGRTCVSVAADGTTRRWPVPAPLAEPDLARLADRVALMTGQRMDESQGLDYIPAAEWRALRVRLVGDGSTALVPPRPDADWHDAAAADAEQDGDAFGAAWNLDRLAALRPADWILAARRGRVLASAGRRDEAAAAYADAARLAPSAGVVIDWLRAAAEDEEAAGRTDGAAWNLARAAELGAPPRRE